MAKKTITSALPPITREELFKHCEVMYTAVAGTLRAEIRQEITGQMDTYRRSRLRRDEWCCHEMTKFAVKIWQFLSFLWGEGVSAVKTPLPLIGPNEGYLSKQIALQMVRGQRLILTVYQGNETFSLEEIMPPKLPSARDRLPMLTQYGEARMRRYEWGELG